MAASGRKISRRGIIRWIVVLALLLIFVLCLILFRPGQKPEEAVEETAPYALDSSAYQRFGVMDDGILAVASGGGLQLFNEAGGLIARSAVTLLQPALDTAGGWAAAWDIGGTTLVTMNAEGESTLLEENGAILSVSVAEDGWRAVAREAQGYRGMVTVYDKKGETIYEWYSAEDYIVGTALSGRHTLAVLCAGSGGSKIHVFAMDSETELGCFVSEELILDLFWTGEDDLAALSESRAVFLDDAGTQKAEYVFSGLHLYDYSSGGNGLLTLVLSAYRTGGTCTLVTLSASGKVIAERTVEELTGVHARGKQILVRSGGVLTLYNQQLEEMRSQAFDPLGVRQALLLQNGRALLIYDYSCTELDL